MNLTVKIVQQFGHIWKHTKVIQNSWKKRKETCLHHFKKEPPDPALNSTCFWKKWSLTPIDDNLAKACMVTQAQQTKGPPVASFRCVLFNLSVLQSNHSLSGQLYHLLCLSQPLLFQPSISTVLEEVLQSSGSTLNLHRTY